MGGLSLEERYFAAHCAMLFVTSIAAIIVGFGMIWLARRKRDPARWSMTWIKFATLFFVLYCLVEFCADAVYIAYSRVYRSTKDPDTSHDHSKELRLAKILLQARIELAAAARFTDCVQIILTFLTIIFLSTGVNLVRRGQPGKSDRWVKLVAYGFSVILAIICTVEWGIRIKVYLEFYTDDYDFEGQEGSIIGLLNASRQLDFAFVTICFALAICTMGRAIQIWLPSRSEKHIDYPILYLLLVTALWLIRSLFDLIYQLKLVNITDADHDPITPPFMEMLDIVFHSWTIFAIICLMFALGGRKQGGLWSTEQPFMTNSEESQSIALQPRDASPPAYSSASSSPTAPIPATHIRSTGPPTGSSTGPSSAQATGGYTTQSQQTWSPRPPPSEDLGEHDQALIAGLGPMVPQQYRPPMRDNAYNTGIVTPASPSEAGPADGYGAGMSIPPHSPPPHDEAMGLYHQADGRRPDMEPLPYPEKN